MGRYMEEGIVWTEGRPGGRRIEWRYHRPIWRIAHAPSRLARIAASKKSLSANEGVISWGERLMCWHPKVCRDRAHRARAKKIWPRLCYAELAW